MEMVFSELRPHRGAPIGAASADGAYPRLYQLDWQSLRHRLAVAGELLSAPCAARSENFARKCASFSLSAARMIAANKQEDDAVNQLCSTIGKSLHPKPTSTAGEGSPLKVDPVESSIFE